MKSKLLKIFAALGVTGVLAMSGTASACSYDYEYNSEESHEKAGLQCHTYYGPEAPFIW